MVVVRPPDHIFVYYIVVGFQYVAICQTRVFRQFLKLRAGYEVVALLTRQDLKHLLRVGVQVQFVKLAVLQRQYFLEHAHFVHVLELLVVGCDDLDNV